MTCRLSGITVAVLAGLFTSSAAFATNGYFSHGYSTKEKGLAGAGTAYSQDSLAAATNPAGMAFIGERMDIGLQLFSPSPRSYTVTGNVLPPPPAPGSNPNVPFGSGINAQPGAEVESDRDFFLIPSFGYNWVLDNGSTVGVSVYGNGGMNTDYPASSTPFGAGTFGSGDTGISLAQLFTNVSFTKKVKEKHAIGASVIVAMQRFYAKGLDNFAAFSVDPNNMTGNRRSDSYGAGLKLGYQGEVAEGFRVGVSYQSKISMGEFDEYKGLFAEGGDFDIPSTYNVGVSYDVTDTSIFIADIQRINFTDVASISNPVNNGFTQCIPAPFSPSGSAQGAGCLGGSNGMGFGWEDMTIYKIGYQFDVGDNTFRVGYSHTDQPIPESETLFNVLAPAVIEDHFTAGMTMHIAENQELDFAAMYAPSSSVKGPNPFDTDPNTGVSQSQVEIEMSQLDFQVSWAIKY
jgi:long-chain fatty acid transport protein